MLKAASALHHDIVRPSDPFEGKLSFKGKRWSSPFVDEQRVEYLVNGYGLPEMVARLMVLRNLDNEDIDGFLNPTLAAHFPDPFKMMNMDATSDYLAAAVLSGKTIGILADFDVDGATSCAVLSRFLKQVSSKDIPVFIPDRLSDGYGPSAKGFDSLKEQGCDIVVILDCGITSVEPITHARSIGLEVVVVDHHEPDEALPDANHIVNPKLKGDNSGYTMLAAVGVTYLLAVAINAKLRQSGHYEVNKEPSLRHDIDLVALGTVCDMVPLLGPNRLFVKYGFPMMAQRRNIGLNALLTVSKITTMPDPYHAGFMLGPRINAGSRVHQSDLGAKLLSTDDEAEAMRLAWLLDDCNEKRKAIQKDMTREAMEKAKCHMIEHPDCDGLVIDGEGWHTGLSGLVAGAIKDKYEKPACVIAFVENEHGEIEGRASGRSVPGVPLADIFMEGQKEGLLVKGGGHAMAGGFTIEKGKIDAFRTFFNTKVKEFKMLEGGVTQDEDTIELMMAVRSLSVKTVTMLTESMGPFGMGHAEPVTILSNVVIDYADQVGTNHLRCTVKDCEGSVGMKAMAFRALETDLGKSLREMAGTGRSLHLRGQVKINEWQGRQSVEFHIEDAMCV